MAPGTHLLISWLCTVEILQRRRERVIVSLCGVIPDVDGLGLVIDKFSSSTSYYIKYHHFLGHSVSSAFVFACIASVIAKKQKLMVWILSFILVHLHIFCDVIGSKGPDGYHWPVYYLYPFDSNFELIWQYQWELNAWQNMLITVSSLILCVYYATTKKITFLEVFSKRLDEEAFNMYRKYVGGYAN